MGEGPSGSRPDPVADQDDDDEGARRSVSSKPQFSSKPHSTNANAKAVRSVSANPRSASGK